MTSALRSSHGRQDPLLLDRLDDSGDTPLHVAALRGHVRFADEILNRRPELAKELDSAGSSALHVGQRVHTSLVNAKDDYGFTVLHLAVSNKQLRTIEYLINNTGIKVNALTTNGFTALDILVQSHRDLKDMVILQARIAVGAFQTTTSKSKNNSLPLPSLSSYCHNKLQVTLIIKRIISAISNDRNKSWILRKHESLLVGASLIATMAFQAGMNPPSGVWHADNPAMNRTAGISVFAEKHLKLYNKFLAFNTTGLTTSMIVILILITGLTSKHLIFVRILIVAMWVAMCSMAHTYGYFIRFFTPKEYDATLFLRMANVITFVVSTSFILFFLKKLFYILTHHEKKVNVQSQKSPTNQLPQF